MNTEVWKSIERKVEDEANFQLGLCCILNVTSSLKYDTSENIAPKLQTVLSFFFFFSSSLDLQNCEMLQGTRGKL